MIHDYILRGPLDMSRLSMSQLKLLGGFKNKTSLASNSSDDHASSMNGECLHDVIVVGAGVAGSALAYALAKDGRRVHLIERDLREPDRIVGELLQPGGYGKLVELGLKDCVTEIDAQEIQGYVFYKDGKYIEVPFPLRNRNSNLSGRCFHNGRFVQKMRNKVASLQKIENIGSLSSFESFTCLYKIATCVLLEEGTVTSLLKQQGTVIGVQYKTKNNQEIKSSHAPLTIVCDGYFSNLRRGLCEDAKVKTTSYMVGWIKEKSDSLPYANYGRAILSNPPCMSYPISSTETRCFVVVPGQKLPSISNGDLFNYIAKLSSQWSPEFRTALMPGRGREKIRAMPCGEMTISPFQTPGTILLGDAFNIRHPIAGGGMTVALSDVVVMRNLLRPLTDLKDRCMVHKHLQSFYTLREPMATTINTVAGCIDRVFCNPASDASGDLQDLFLDYLRLGSTYASGAMCLVSGLNLHPWNMLNILSSLLPFIARRLLLPFPTPKRVKLAIELASVTAGLVFSAVKAHKGKNSLLLYAANAM